MKFTDLTEADKIQKVKDKFATILEGLAEGSLKLEDYISAPAKPANGADKEVLSAYETQLERYTKAKEIIQNVNRQEGCICGTCVNIKFGAMVPRELEPIIQAAKKQAQEATY